jgi:quinol monooxygenase YgiN
MKFRNYASLSAVVFLAAVSASAQTTSGNLAAIESQTPKTGMTQQYEQGRKQKADWHKQQKDPSPLLVFETMSGDSTGTYLVGRLGLHWADLDKPPIPDASDTDEYNKVIGSYVQSLTDRYYMFMPKVSNPDNSSDLPAPYTELVTFRVRREKIGEFESALARLGEAVQKTKWPIHYEFYRLVNSGFDGTFVLIEPHANWADFEEKPEVKPFRDMLKDAFGQVEADSIVGRLDSSIESEYSEIIKFRQDLSYIPAK